MYETVNYFFRKMNEILEQYVTVLAQRKSEVETASKRK